MAAVAHSLLAALSVALAWVVVRRADRAEAEAAHHRETVAIVMGARRRDRVELDGLSRRALDLEASISHVNQRHLDATGAVTDGGAMLACAVLQLRVDIAEVRRGQAGEGRDRQ